MEILIILIILIIVTFVWDPLAIGNKIETKQIKYFLENGKCYKCKADNQNDLKSVVSNKPEEHDSILDIEILLHCKCDEGCYIRKDLLHNSKDLYLYNLALDFKNERLPWVSHWKEEGRKKQEEELNKYLKDVERAKKLGIISKA